MSGENEAQYKMTKLEPIRLGQVRKETPLTVVTRKFIYVMVEIVYIKLLTYKG